MTDLAPQQKRAFSQKEVQALGSDYFADASFPLACLHIKPEKEDSHYRDLTTVPHRHDFCELVLVLSGRGVQVIDGEPYQVTAGDFFLVQQGKLHFFTDRGSFELVNFLYAPERLPLPVALLEQIPGYRMIFQLEPQLPGPNRSKVRLHLGPRTLAALEERAAKLDETLRSSTPASRVAAFALFLDILIKVSGSYGLLGDPGGGDLSRSRLGELIGELERQYAQTWSLARMSQFCCVSANTLMRNFQTVMGCSPIHYLLGVRLRHAAKMLTESTASVAEVGERCGFADSNYFSRRFSALYGVSPRLYRRSIRKMAE